MGLFDTIKEKVGSAVSSIGQKVNTTYSKVDSAVGGVLPGGVAKTTSLRSSSSSSSNIVQTTAPQVSQNSSSTKTTSLRSSSSSNVSTAIKNYASNAYSAVDKYAFSGLLPGGDSSFSNITDPIDQIQSDLRERSLRKDQEKIDYQEQKLFLYEDLTGVKADQEQAKIRRDLSTYNWTEWFDKTERALNEQRRTNEAANIQIDLSSQESALRDQGLSTIGYDPYKLLDQAKSQASSSSSSFGSSFTSNLGATLGKALPWIAGAVGAVWIFKKK